MNTQGLLNKREEKVMQYLWDSGEPMTIDEIVKLFSEENLSRATIFKAVQTLTQKGYIVVSGVELKSKTYARRIEPSLTKEEYAALLLEDKGIAMDGIGNLVAAMIGNSKSSNAQDDEKVIKDLEDIISQIRKRKE